MRTSAILCHSQQTMSNADPASRETIDNIQHGSLSTSEIIKDETDKSSQTAVEDLNNRLSLSTVDDASQKQTVVLVVANSRDDTVGLVESLKSSFNRDGDWRHHTTAAGVRIYETKSRLIVETIPLHYMRGGRRSDIARRWISRNCLRRILCGKDIIVVCVLLCRLVNTRKSILSAKPEQWMEIFGLVFKPLRSAVIVLADMEGETLRPGVELFVRDHGLLEQNIIYTDGDGGYTELGSVIEDTICPSSTPTTATIVPVSMPEDLPEEMRLIWGPERVILFGRAGSGKSTLAQMLTAGDLDPQNTTFVPSKGIRGESTKIQSGTGRGWYVLDTPGFGECEDPSSSISTLAKRIKKIAKLEGTFSHYLYVVKMGRLDRLDQNLWDFFTGLFGEEVRKQFSIVISHAQDDWVEGNRSDLEESFHGCKRFFSAYFPKTRHIPEKDLAHLSEDWNLRAREESLRVLEEQLAKLGLVDIYFRSGRTSRLIDLLEIDGYETLLPAL